MLSIQNAILIKLWYLFKLKIRETKWQVWVLSILPIYCIYYNLHNGPFEAYWYCPHFQIKKLRLREFKSLTEMIYGEAKIQTRVCC